MTDNLIGKAVREAVLDRVIECAEEKGILSDWHINKWHDYTAYFTSSFSGANKDGGMLIHLSFDTYDIFVADIYADAYYITVSNGNCTRECASVPMVSAGCNDFDGVVGTIFDKIMMMARIVYRDVYQ